MRRQKRENQLLNILFNVIVPSVILIKFSDSAHLGAVKGLIVALLFPISYGVFDLIKRQKWNFFSILGLVSVLLTGGIGLLKLSPEVLAIKEAAVPFLIGCVIFFAEKRFGFAEKMLLNDEVFDTEKIRLALRERGSEKAFAQKIRRASFVLAGAFFVSAVLNFVLARMIVVSPAGSEEFSVELGKMTAASYPVIVVPMMIAMLGILIFLLRSIRETTGMPWEELLRGDAKT